MKKFNKEGQDVFENYDDDEYFDEDNEAVEYDGEITNLRFNEGKLDGVVLTWTADIPCPTCIQFKWFNCNTQEKTELYRSLHYTEQYLDEIGRTVPGNMYYQLIDKATYRQERVVQLKSWDEIKRLWNETEAAQDGDKPQ